MIADCFLIMESCVLDSRGKAQPGAVRFIETLLKHSLSFVILTDQSLLTRGQMADRMMKAGFSRISEEMFYTSTMAAVDAIRRKYPDRRTAGYIGSRGMVEILRLGGFALNMERADWLFVGSDHDASYNDYCYALKLVDRGAYIISTDQREYETTRSGKLIGSGSVVKMLEHATGTKAVETGMPAPLIVSRALKYLDVSAEDAVLVGCHPEPEIACGLAAGIRTVLCMTGMDDTENALLRRVHPDFVVEDLNGLLR